MKATKRRAKRQQRGERKGNSLEVNIWQRTVNHRPADLEGKSRREREREREVRREIKIRLN